MSNARPTLISELDVLDPNADDMADLEIIAVRGGVAYRLEQGWLVGGIADARAAIAARTAVQTMRNFVQATFDETTELRGEIDGIETSINTAATQVASDRVAAQTARGLAETASAQAIAAAAAMSVDIVNRLPVRPSLDLNFARDDAALSKITFARSSGGSYFDAAGVLRTAANNVPRVDHDPLTGECLGVLVEEARTNLVLDSSMSGASVDTNALPTGWGIGSYAGVTRQIVAVGLENGLPYIDVRLYGTPTSSGNLNLTYVGAQPIAAGQYAVVSQYIRLLQGNSPTVRMRHFVRDVSNNQLSNVNRTLSLSTERLVREVHSALAPADASNDLFNLTFGMVSGQAFDATYRIAAPQIEISAGDFATSFIPTTSAAATRAADAITVAVGSWLNPKASTVLFDGSTFRSLTNTATDRATLFFFNGSSQNSFEGFFSLNGTFQILGSGATLGGAGRVGPSPAQGQRTKVALAYGDGIISGTVDAAAVGEVSGRNMPQDLGSVYVGYRAGSSRHLNGHIRRLTVYPRRLSNANLQLLTA